MKKQQGGFTMIELIMVIVILGILAAFALPRFADFGTDAQVATMKGALGSVKSASGIAHAQALLKAPADSKIKLEGIEITMIGTYPTATKTGIGAAAQLSEQDFSITDATGTSGAGTFEVAAKGKAACKFTYTIAAAGTDGVQAAPTYNAEGLTVANCK